MTFATKYPELTDGQRKQLLIELLEALPEKREVNNTALTNGNIQASANSAFNQAISQATKAIKNYITDEENV